MEASSRRSLFSVSLPDVRREVQEPAQLSPCSVSLAELVQFERQFLCSSARSFEEAGSDGVAVVGKLAVRQFLPMAAYLTFAVVCRFHVDGANITLRSDLGQRLVNRQTGSNARFKLMVFNIWPSPGYPGYGYVCAR